MSTPATLRLQTVVSYLNLPPAPARYRVFFYQEAASGFDRGQMVSMGFSEYLDREAAETAAAQWEGRP